MKQETLAAQSMRKEHKKHGIETDYNQTIVKGQKYGFSGSGYSVKGYGGYCKITIVEALKDDFHSFPAWWNKEIFDEIYRCGKVYGGYGRGNKTAYDSKRKQYNKEYPGLIWV